MKINQTDYKEFYDKVQRLQDLCAQQAETIVAIKDMLADYLDQLAKQIEELNNV